MPGPAVVLGEAINRRGHGSQMSFVDPPVSDAIPIHGGGLDMEMEMPSPSSGPHGCCPSSRGGVLDELEVWDMCGS